jgi:ATP-binding cassette subfamily B (MDR/TAP) protein 1
MSRSVTLADPSVQILDGLNLELSAGKVTAIVGPSGSGKSAIVSLIQRWYDLIGTTADPITIGKTNDTVPVDEPGERDVELKQAKIRIAKSSTPKKDTKEPDDEEIKAKETKSGPHTCTGTIRIGNVDLRNVDLKWWRSQIRLVQQDSFLFNDTLFNNVAFGLFGTHYQNLSKEEKREMVKQACREAHAEEFISYQKATRHLSAKAASNSPADRVSDES